MSLFPNFREQPENRFCWWIASAGVLYGCLLRC